MQGAGAEPRNGTTAPSEPPRTDSSSLRTLSRTHPGDFWFSFWDPVSLPPHHPACPRPDSSRCINSRVQVLSHRGPEGVASLKGSFPFGTPSPSSEKHKQDVWRGGGGSLCGQSRGKLWGGGRGPQDHRARGGFVKLEHELEPMVRTLGSNSGCRSPSSLFPPGASVWVQRGVDIFGFLISTKPCPSVQEPSPQGRTAAEASPCRVSLCPSEQPGSVQAAPWFRILVGSPGQGAEVTRATASVPQAPILSHGEGEAGH